MVAKLDDAKIKVRIRGKLEETTPGRVKLFEIIPDEVPFEVINRTMPAPGSKVIKPREQSPSPGFPGGEALKDLGL